MVLLGRICLINIPEQQQRALIEAVRVAADVVTAL